MTTKSGGLRPGRGWQIARRITQTLALLTLVVAPVLGGWQRLDRNYLAAWNGYGWDLPAWLLVELPLGDAPRQAYEATKLVGGGVGVEYFEIPFADPAASVIAQLGHAEFTPWVVLAWVLPIALALLAGRVFCGWFCPFGVIARGFEFLLERLPWQPPRFAVPARRSLRLFILIGAIAVGIAGVELALYLLLPHLLVQQAVYGMWLMGGGGAALGALIGLLGAGVLFGPTTYCASLCPTGTALALAGNVRRVRLQLISPASCGKHCDLCDRGCWLDLTPSRGTPGPDCDLCARCTEVCPKDNLVIAPARRPANEPIPAHPSIAARVAVVVGALLLGTCISGCQSYIDPGKPRLLLEAHHEHAGAEVAVAVVDYTGIHFAPDDPRDLRGTEISVYVVRGDRGRADERGSLPPRDVYKGPLTIHVRAGAVSHDLAFDKPNYPTSTPNRTIYRRVIDNSLDTGATITLDPIPGWLDTRTEWTVADPDARGSLPRVLGYALATWLLFAGLLSFALLPSSTTTSRSSDKPDTAVG